MCRWNDDLEIGWRARKESSGVRFRDAEPSFGMDVGKQFKLKWWTWKPLASERQLGWYQETVGVRADGSGFKANGHASKRADAALRRKEMPVNRRPYAEGCLDVCCRQCV
jgi:hypothetical protein